MTYQVIKSIFSS